MIRSVLKSLLKPDAYPELTTGVELVQTHVSYIFLTDQYAYKIKKPVDFGFLNFSTIDRRRFYCNEEVRLNRRLCPDMYLGVVELRETGSGAAFIGSGAVLDYAVKMKRLPADRMLDKLIDFGKINTDTMRSIARTIAEFHRTAVTTPAIAEFGRLDRILYNWQENFDQMIPFESSTLPTAERECIESWVTGFCEEHGDLFQKRVDEGFIRECDGDIHLENICLDEDGTIQIFDCIEFNDRFRYCDTAADLAFLLMDLDYHGRHDLTINVIADYIAASGDSGATGMIDFYKIYRAYVRGKVESYRMNDIGISSEEQIAARNRARQYFRLVRGYIERRKLKKTLFITCGLMGTGKSTLAEQLAFELGIVHLSSDVIRKQVAGADADELEKAPFNEGNYSLQSRHIVYTELLSRADRILAAGGSVVVDACFPLASERARCAERARHNGAAFVILDLECSRAEISRRLVDRENRGSSVSDGRLDLLASQEDSFEQPVEGEGTLIRLNSSVSPVTMMNEIYPGLFV